MMSPFHHLGILANLFQEQGAPADFEKWPVEVQDCRKIDDRFRGIYRRRYLNLTKKNQKMSTCNWKDWDLDQLCPRISPGTEEENEGDYQLR